MYFLFLVEFDILDHDINKVPDKGFLKMSLGLDVGVDGLLERLKVGL